MLDEQILKQSLEAGHTYVEAGRRAGSKHKDDSNVIHEVSALIEQKPELDRPVLDIMKDKRRRILKSIKNIDIKKASLSQKMVGLGVLTDKIQLLENKPTNILEVAPKMVFEDNKVKFISADKIKDKPKTAS